MRVRLFTLLVVPAAAALVLASLIVVQRSADHDAAKTSFSVAVLADEVAALDKALGDEALASSQLVQSTEASERPAGFVHFFSTSETTDSELARVEARLANGHYHPELAKAVAVVKATLAFREDVASGTVSPLQILDRYSYVRGLVIDALTTQALVLTTAIGQQHLLALVDLIEARSAHLDERVAVELARRYRQWAPGLHSAVVTSVANQNDHLRNANRFLFGEEVEPPPVLRAWRKEISISDEAPRINARAWSELSDDWIAELDGEIQRQRTTTMSFLAAEESAANATQWAAIVGVGIAIVVAILIASVVSVRLVRRVSIITQQARRMAAGSSIEKTSPRVMGTDELGQLANAFDEMTTGIETRTKNQWIESTVLEAIVQGASIDEVMERTAPLLGTGSRGEPLYRFVGGAEDLEIEARAESAGQAERRPTPASMVVLYIDLDHFKAINDQFGHSAGDRVLIAQAARLTDMVSEYDGTAGRLGGDEFLVLLPRVEDEATLRKITNRLVAELAEPVPASKGSYQVGVSIGGVLTRPDVPALKLLNDADAALYEAKKQGRGHALISDQRLRDQILDAEQLHRDVLEGLEDHQFTPWFQPIWGDGGATLAGMEALARWHHPERGLVSPGIFLPVAEEANVLSQLDRLMFEQVCRQVVVWREAGLELDMVHYNMSTAWLEEPDFVSETARILAETGCPPESIVAEVTESGLMTDISSNSHRLQELRERGIRIAVDDFGQGYSSLAYLSDLPVDLLKIDRRFVDRIDQEESNQAIVSAVVNLGSSLGLRIVAEGVERSEELDYLVTAGTDLFQGFLLAKPLPVEEATAMLGRTRPPEADDSAGRFPAADAGSSSAGTVDAGSSSAGTVDAGSSSVGTAETVRSSQ